ncbi:MAG: laccase domain-containing protein [Actinomycetota bacterium]|nr:laccase domain-containing protein [Actinomycetota bacterium]
MCDIRKIKFGDMLMYSPLRLKEKYGIDLYFTSRLGGNSSSPYRSLNLAYHVGDDYENVSANRRTVLEELKLGQQVYDIKQVHSDRIVDLGQEQLSARRAVKDTGRCSGYRSWSESGYGYGR